jgi:hypothetical protein
VHSLSAAWYRVVGIMSDFSTNVFTIAGIAVVGALAWWQRDAIAAWLKGGTTYTGKPGTGVVIPPGHEGDKPGTEYWSGEQLIQVSVPTNPAGYSTRDALVSDYCRLNPWDENFCSAFGGAI